MKKYTIQEQINMIKQYLIEQNIKELYLIEESNIKNQVEREEILFNDRTLDRYNKGNKFRNDT